MSDPDREEVSLLEGTRREQEDLQAEVQEMKNALLLQLDDPAYENLECSQLEDTEEELEALLKLGRRHKSKLSLEEANPDTKAADDRAWKSLQQLVTVSKVFCRRLRAIREVHGKIQTADKILRQLKERRLEHPHRDYAIPVRRISEKVTDLLETLEASTIPSDHKLRARAMELEISLEDMEIVDILLTPPDTKDFSKETTRSAYKRAPLAVPTFSGELKDWVPFWRSFKEAVHDAKDLNDTAKLAYLKSAMKDKNLFRKLNRPSTGDDFYNQMVKMLQDQFDKPIEMHRIYMQSLMDMEPVKLTKSSLQSFAETICEALDGIRELKQTDVIYIITSMAVSFLPQKVKQSWDEKLEGCKQVPTAEKLVEFIRAKADNPSYVDKPVPYKPKVLKPPVNVASAQPVPASPPPTDTTTSSAPVKGNGYSNKVKHQSFPPCRYSCPLCSESHYAYSCKVFREKTVAQRKEFATAQSLCSKCLKPGHTPEVCRSKFNSQVCDGPHNTLIHGAGGPKAAEGTVNTTVSTPSANHPKLNKLMMTCEAMATGPTGKTMPVRALLDSGADISSITTQVAAHLQLKQLDSSIAVATFGNNEQKIC